MNGTVLVDTNVNGTVVDTNVFTAPMRADRPLQAHYRKHTFGRRLAVAPQTVAEANHGALMSGWGARRQSELARLIAGVRVVPTDETRRSSVLRSFAISVV